MKYLFDITVISNMNTGDQSLVGKPPICFTHPAISETKNVMKSEDWSILEFIHKKDTIENYISFLEQGTYLDRFFVVSDNDTPTNAIFHIISFPDTDQRVKCHSDDIFNLVAVLTEDDWEAMLRYVDEENMYVRNNCYPYIPPH